MSAATAVPLVGTLNAAACRRAGIDPGESLVTAEDNGRHIVVSHGMHPDSSGRRMNGLFFHDDADWERKVAEEIDAAVRGIAPLVHRRRAIAEAGGGRRMPLSTCYRAADHQLGIDPRWSWTLNPVAASILSLFPRAHSRLTREQRLDGGNGRSFEMHSDRVIGEFVYGDGMIRMTGCTVWGDNGRVRIDETDDRRMRMRIDGAMPDTLMRGLAGQPPGAICALFGRDARSRHAILETPERVETDAGRCEVHALVRDVLVPWDARRRGGEGWRPSRTACPEGLDS